MPARIGSLRSRVEVLEDRDVPALFGAPLSIPGANYSAPAVTAVADFNNDGRDDVAATNSLSSNPNTLTVVFGQAGGTFGNPAAVALSASAAQQQPEGLVAADLDNDGDPDLAAVLNATGTNNVKIVLNSGSFSGNLAVTQTLTAGTNPTHITAADFNGDGFLDLAVSNFGGTVNIYLNTPANPGSFTAGQTITLGGGANGSNVIVAGDFNGAGGIDLAVADQTTNNVSVLLGAGNGTFTEAAGSPMASGTGATFLTVGDLDGDGNTDLVASNTFTNTIRTFYGNGDGSFTPEAPVTVGATPTGVVIADLNGDQLPDIAVGVASTGRVVVRMNQGGGRNFATATGSPFTAVSNVTWVGVGDFNQDGRPDLVTTQYQDPAAPGNVGTMVNVLSNTLTPTTTELTGPTATTAGQTVTLTATVTPAGGGTVTTGFVSFFDGATFLSTQPVAAGSATFTSTTIPAGTHSFNARYSDVSALTFFGSRSLAPAPSGPLVVSGGANGAVSLFVPASNGQYPTNPTANLTPFPGITGILRTATGDVNNDGVPDTIVVTGPGTPIRVTVISGADSTTALVPAFDPFGGGFTGGGFVSAADLDGDGAAEFVVSPDLGGGPRVTIFSFATAGAAATQRANFFGIDDPNFRGGARTAIGDLNRDGNPELIVAAGFGGGPRVAVFRGNVLSGTPTRLVGDFFAFPGSDAVNLRNGVFLASGDVDGDGFADLIFGGGPGGAPRVYILSGALTSANRVADAQATPIANFFVAGNSSDRGGVRVAAKTADGDAKADVAVGSGEGSPAKVRVYLGANFVGSGEPATFQDIPVFGGGALAGGVFVG